MQTSQIIIGETYALPDSTLGTTVRFHVTAITTVTRRTSNKKATAADTKNTVHGIIDEDDAPGISAEERKRNVFAEAITGHYAEFKDLKDKQAERDRIGEAREAKRLALQLALIAKLYEMTGLERPSDLQRPSPGSFYKSTHKDPIRADFNGVEITEYGIERVLAVLEGIDPARSFRDSDSYDPAHTTH